MSQSWNIQTLQSRPFYVNLNEPEAAVHRSLNSAASEQPEQNIYTKTWFQVIGIYLLVQAIIGIIGIEYAWYRTKRFREQDSKRDQMFPAFSRSDAKYWARWKFYPGAMLMMPTRVIFLFLDTIFLTLLISILTIGHDFKKGPMKNGCRKWSLFFLYHVCCTFFLFVVGMQTTLTYKDVDYTYYLGSDYKRNMKKIKRTSTICSNHVSWLDPVILIKNVRPAFAPSEEFARVPLLATLMDVIDSIYIPRGGSQESKARALMTIRDRQEMIEQTGQYAPFLIFPEGGTTNGQCILNMKKGAFFAEKTIRPLFMKYKQGTVSPAYDVMEFLPLMIFQLSWTCFRCDLTVLPDFQPNEFLFETHQDKGKERWEIIAWAIRDIMCFHGEFHQCDIPLRKKLEYESYMQMVPGANLPENSVCENENLLKQSMIQIQDSEKKQLHQVRPESINHSMNKGNSDEEMFSSDIKERQSELSLAPPVSRITKNYEDINQQS